MQKKKARALPLTSVLLLLIIDVVDSSAMSSAMMFSLIFWIISCACKASCSSDFMRAWRQASRFFDLRDNKKKEENVIALRTLYECSEKKSRRTRNNICRAMDAVCVWVASCVLVIYYLIWWECAMQKKKCFLNKIRSGHRVYIEWFCVVAPHNIHVVLHNIYQQRSTRVRVCVCACVSNK